MHARGHAIAQGNMVKRVLICPNCRNKFTSIEDRKFCSHSCSASYHQVGLQRKFSVEELENLVWTLPTTKIAEKMNCSDVAVAKLCKKWGVSKPPRGYWRKQQFLS
jgi:hypothetical protein